MNGDILLKIGCHNVEGLSKKLCEDDYVEFVHSHDIFCFQETFTHENFDFSIYFNEFEHFHKPGVKLNEKGRRSGGIAVLIKKTVSKFIQQINYDEGNILCFKVDKKATGTDCDIILIMTYIHPYQSSFYNDKDVESSLVYLEECITMVSERFTNLHYLIMGDLNSRIGNWNLQQEVDEEHDKTSGVPDTYGTRVSRDNITNMFGRQLITLCEMCQLVPLNGNTKGDEEGKFTFVSTLGKSVIDYALVSADIFMEKICCLHVLPNVESLHAPLYVPIYGQRQCNKQRQKPEPSKKITILKWDVEKSPLFKAEIEKCSQKIKEAENMIDINPDGAVKLFTDTIVTAASCMRRTVRIRTGRRKVKNDWYDDECTFAKDDAKEAKYTYDEAQDDKENELKYFKLRSRYKNITRDKKRTSRRNKVHKLLLSKNDGGKFWREIKELKTNVKPNPSIEIEIWKDHFEKIFNNIDNSKERGTTEKNTNKDMVCIESLDKQITRDEIKESIQALKSGKAAGIDEISGEFIKSAQDVILPFLFRLFNKMYETSFYPVEWCKAVIVPILKKGNDSDPDNYRGISLLSVISKTFSAILNKRLYAWCEKENTLSFEQAAFRKSFSTTDHIFTLTTIIQNRLHNKMGGKVYACFVDYHKAYDHVNRSSLWEVMTETGVSSMMISMFKTMYCSVLSCVRWNGTMSGMFNCPNGLRQGCLCSPLSFALLIGKVADFVRTNGKHGFQLIPGGPEIFQLLFADDIVLLSSTPQGLQNQINNLAKASQSLGLTINMEKTKTMVFRKGGFLGTKEKWYFYKQQLETVNSYKYLGYTLTTRLSDTTACKEFAVKARRKIFDILKTLWALTSFNTVIFFQLFDAQVKSMLLYAAKVWGWKQVEEIEATHLFACKKLLSVSHRTPNHMIYGETGRHPIHIYAKLASVRYWLKIMKMPNNRLPKQALLSMKTFHDRDESDKRAGWYTAIKLCLVENGFDSVWENGGTLNEKAFLKNLKVKMISEFEQAWGQKMKSSERFIFYDSFKKIHHVELYLNDITVKKFRDAMIRFRLGLNSLKVNNRFSKVSENKDCPFCENTHNS